MDNERVPQVVQKAMETWGQRLAWIIVDREDNDYFYSIGVEDCTDNDKRQIVDFVKEFNPDDDSHPYAYSFYVYDFGLLERFAEHIRKQMVYNRDALAAKEQAATAHA